MPDHSLIESTVNHFFRHQSGKMVAVLTRIFGPHNLELAEDVVQETLLTALEQWKIKGIPQSPEDWLFIVSKNKALNLIKKKRSQILFGDENTSKLLSSGYTVETTFNQLANDELIKDDQLRMMYACCHPGISEENQVTLILKTLCGFSTVEIAKAFLTSEDTISKRLYRSKEYFRENKIQLVLPEVEDLQKRTGAVLNAIYLLFNEGYNSTHSHELIRKDLMEEAIVLCKLLTENSYTQLPEVNALMALICFHAARSESRLSESGDIILLANQNRAKWNKGLINEGSNYLQKAAYGNSISAYHLEAAIAAQHCLAPDYDATNWSIIIQHYNLLLQMSPSPVTALNRVVAILQYKGAEMALEELNAIKDKHKLTSYYLYYSLMGEIHARLNKLEESVDFFEKAFSLTLSEHEKKMLATKINNLITKM